MEKAERANSELKIRELLGIINAVALKGYDFISVFVGSRNLIRKDHGYRLDGEVVDL